MLVFNKKRFAKQVVLNHLVRNEYKAKYKLYIAAQYFIHETRYNPTEWLERMRLISKEYFRGIQGKDVDIYLNEILEKAKKDKPDWDHVSNDKISIYKEELEIINLLDTYNLRKLAFVFLVYAKVKDLEAKDSKRKKSKWIKECNADLFRLAQINASGKTKQAMTTLLYQEDIVKFECFNDYSYKFGKQFVDKKSGKMIHKNIVNNVVCVSIKRENGAISFEIPYHDLDNMILYYRRYLEEKDIFNCSKCGCPIVRTNNKKKYCISCAEENQHQRNKAQRIQKI